MSRKNWLFILALIWPASVMPAPGIFRPPAFVGGIPGRVQMQSIVNQRHQARTLLYREAIEELRRNPSVADVPDCSATLKGTDPCLPTATVKSVPKDVATQPVTRRIALLIGNDHYTDPIPKLDTPIDDISAVADVLRSRYGFNDVRILQDATKIRTINAMAKLAHDAQPGDSVLIFYAGHGYLMDDTNMGYWIPTDGSTTTAVQWISNQDISKLLRAIPARQLILVSDSCFSGSLTREQKISGSDDDPGTILHKRSVVAFSSGGEEPVSDGGREGHSIFAWHFLQSLKHLGAITLGHNIYTVISYGVQKDYPQTPQYGAMVSAGHENGGEYLFYPHSK